MATNSWSKSLRKVRWRSQSKQRDRWRSVFFVRCACAIAFAFAFAWPCRMPGIWCISWSIAVRAARGCMGQRSTSSSRRWCSEEETWSRWSQWSWWFWAWTQLRCRSDHLVILCHFVYRYLQRTWKVSLAIYTGLSSDNFSSNTSHLSTAVFQRCEQRKGWSQSAGTTCSSSWRGSWHLFRQSPRTSNNRITWSTWNPQGGRPDASKSSWRSAAPEALAERVSKKARGSKNQATIRQPGMVVGA